MAENEILRQAIEAQQATIAALSEAHKKEQEAHKKEQEAHKKDVDKLSARIKELTA